MPATPRRINNEVGDGRSHDPSPIPNTRYRAAASWPSLPSLPHFAQRRAGWRGEDGHIGATLHPPHSCCPAVTVQRSAPQCRSSRPFALRPVPSCCRRRRRRRISSHRPSPTPSPSSRPSPSHRLIRSSWSPLPAIGSVPGCPVRGHSTQPTNLSTACAAGWQRNSLGKHRYTAGHYTLTPVNGPPHLDILSHMCTIPPPLRHILLLSFCHRFESHLATTSQRGRYLNSDGSLFQALRCSRPGLGTGVVRVSPL